MEKNYNLNDLALMTGFTTRTLRNYLLSGVLKGEKIDGVWRFTPEDLDRFFSEPFVKEGIRIKRSAVVFDFLACKDRKTARTCAILDIPATLKQANAISAFFCDKMNDACDVVFTFDWDKGFCRVILSGDAEQVAALNRAFREKRFAD